MIIGPVVSIAVSSSLVLVTVTVGPPTPPVVPLLPSALTEANPSAGPLGIGGGLVEVDGLGDADALGEAEALGDADADAETLTDGDGLVTVSVTRTSSNAALA
jgi:hypothetical protein